MIRTYETERLKLRPFTQEDLEPVCELFADSQVCHFYCGEVKTRSEVQEWLEYRILESRFSDFYAWAVLLKAEERFVGFVRLCAYANRWYRIAGEEQQKVNPLEVELSFAFLRQFWGCGYATEACHPAIQYAFQELKLPRLLGGAKCENQPSARLQERLGYRLSNNIIPGADEYVTILENHELD